LGRTRHGCLLAIRLGEISLQIIVALGIVWLFLKAHLAHAQKLELPAQFDYADDFSDGLALLRIGERTFYIDKNGKQVVTPKNMTLITDFPTASPESQKIENGDLSIGPEA